MILRFILDLREEFALGRGSTEHTFDMSDITTVLFVGQSENSDHARQHATIELREVGAIHKYD
jgi:hypothetical protein